MLEEYLYLDRIRLSSYAEQIGAAISIDKKPTWKVALGLTGPSVAGEQSSSSRAANDHEMVAGLLGYLDKNKLLLRSRPSTDEQAEKAATRFVLETMQARKIIFNCTVDEVPGLTAIAVWVSNPAQSPSKIAASRQEQTHPVGMFVYLIEGYWKADEPFSKAASMFTALNMVLESLQKMGVAHKDKKVLFTSRDDFGSPATILERAGGIKGDSRNIKALYRIRAVSDNKIVRIGDDTIRSYDLFGYPIFITEA